MVDINDDLIPEEGEEFIAVLDTPTDPLVSIVPGQDITNVTIFDNDGKGFNTLTYMRFVWQTYFYFVIVLSLSLSLSLSSSSSSSLPDPHSDPDYSRSFTNSHCN